jgi:hypothetical protein
LDLVVVHVAQDTVSAFHLSSGDHELDEPRQTVSVRGEIIVIHFLRERETERGTEVKRETESVRERGVVTWKTASITETLGGFAMATELTNPQ